jgi:hypothetical protein
MQQIKDIINLQDKGRLVVATAKFIVQQTYDDMSELRGAELQFDEKHAESVRQRISQNLQKMERELIVMKNIVNTAKGYA